MWPFPVVWFEHGVPDTTAEEFLLGAAPEHETDNDPLDEAAEDDDGAKGADDDVPF